jgi:hypothetical protein
VPTRPMPDRWLCLKRLRATSRETPKVVDIDIVPAPGSWHRIHIYLPGGLPGGCPADHPDEMVVDIFPF